MKQEEEEEEGTHYVHYQFFIEHRIIRMRKVYFSIYFIHLRLNVL